MTPPHNHNQCHWPFKRMCQACEALIKDPTDKAFLKHIVKSDTNKNAAEDGMGMFRYMMKYPESGVIGNKCPVSVKLQHMEGTWRQIQMWKRGFMEKSGTVPQLATSKVIEARKFKVDQVSIAGCSGPDYYSMDGPKLEKEHPICYDSMDLPQA